MRIVIAGGSGFLGAAPHNTLRSAGHSVVVLTRTAKRAGDVPWTPDGTAGAWARTLDGADAVVNLAGEGIAGARWTEQRKASLRRSRILSTRSIVAACHSVTTAPAVVVNASGVGYYGARGSEV